MNPTIVNGLVAITGIFAAIGSNYTEGNASDALLTYAVFVLGYAIRRFGDRAPSKRSSITGPS